MQPDSGFKRVIRDVADLFDLQVQLFTLDSRDAMRQIGIALVVTLLATCIFMTTLTGSLFTGAWALHEYAGWTMAQGVGTMCLVGLALTLGAAGYAYRLLVRALASLDEPKRELVENLRWLKAVIVEPNTSARNQLRRDSFQDPYASAGPSIPPGDNRF
ncbi:hypothetical protein FF011L_26310 [Roseimaritima multifibrata]|uniref:Phage holin family protein n=1 Tax=Roseimaritima multifibrata TaxID=1930274 RepID=A0A517MG62_9BACT|nr:phage holin family protein [Roseimaritima multifibrata]QDS93856.1 hypothetical protein FF011L_26310 [Roseimaritima multifibrata]